MQIKQRQRLLRDAIEGCIDASTACKETVAYCLEAGGAFVDGRFVVMLLGCSDICGTTGQLVVVEPELGAESCRFCARVCERCAERCDEMPDDEQLELCTRSLRRAAEACTTLAESGFWDRTGRQPIDAT
jgi:hypothetical protein